MKSTKVPDTVDEYIANFPVSTQKILEELRAAIKRAAPEAVEKISYQMPTFAQEGNLVHFAAHSNHIGFYPAPSGVIAFKNELAGYKYSKGAIQFPLGKQLPLDLITKIVVFRTFENMQLAELKSAKKKK